MTQRSWMTRFEQTSSPALRPIETLWRALAAVELDVRLQSAGGGAGWIRQDQLSLGEAQRLNLARAWLSERPIVLLDEPTEQINNDQEDMALGPICSTICRPKSL